MTRLWNFLVLSVLVACSTPNIPDVGLFVDPETVDLGAATINPDGTASLWVTVVNTGEEPINLGGITLSRYGT